MNQTSSNNLSIEEAILKRQSKTFEIQSEDQARHIAKTLAAVLRVGDVLFLEGDLGTGKTFLSQALVKGLGFTGKVLSPTYSLVQSYEVALRQHTSLQPSAQQTALNSTDNPQLPKLTPLHHFDLYRLADSEELEYIGIRDYFDSSVCIIEWPSKGGRVLPDPTVRLSLAYLEKKTLDTMNHRNVILEFL